MTSTIEAWEQAKAERVEAEATAERWRARVAELGIQAAALEANMGERALSSPDGAGDVADELARLDVDRRVAEGAVRAAEAAVLVVRSAERAAEAADLRARADVKRQEAEAVEAATAPLLAELAQLQGVEYVASSRQVQAFEGGEGAFASTGPVCRSESLRIDVVYLVGRAIVLEGEAAGVPVHVPMHPLVGRPWFEQLGQTEEDRRSAAAASSVAATTDVAPPSKVKLADRARALVTG